MKRIRLKIETFEKKPQDEWHSWEEEPESLANYEPRIVDGGCDAADIQTYMEVRDDRVAVVMKNGAVLSVVGTLQQFEMKLEAIGL